MKIQVTQIQFKASAIFTSVLKKRKVIGLLLLSAIFTLPAMAQNVTVKGRVTSETNQPLVGASIMVKGTSIGTTTNASGNYEITVPANGTLVISSVGFPTKEIPVSNQATINVSMTTATADMEQVVVVGYGTQRRRDVTGAITKINSETLLQTASHSVVDQLKGQAAGVTITSTNSVPGGSSQIRIRGNRTMVANTPNGSLSGSSAAGQQQQEAATADQADAPLLVVDGIPYSGNLNDISPNDIVSLEILKDASATAIYGSRGAGGVILVTTKRGIGGKMTFSYDAYYGVTTVMDKLRVFNSQEYAKFRQDAREGSSTGTSQYWPLTNAEQQALNAGVSTDWQDLIYTDGPMTNHNLNISGGSEKSRYSMSLGYFYQGGIIPNQNFTRYSIRSAMDHQLSKRIKIGLTTINAVTIQNTPGGQGIPNTLMRIAPWIAPYNPDGSLNLKTQTGPDLIYNPLTLETKEDAIVSRNRRVRTFNSLYAEVNIVDGLRYRANIGLDYYQDRGDGYSGPGTVVNPTDLQSQSAASIRNTDFWQYTIENLLIYEKTFSQKHRLGITGLFSVQKSQSQSSFVRGVGVPFDYMRNTDLYQAASINAGDPGNNYFWERGLISYMGRATYSFDNRFSLTATVRTDGASVLSPGNQYYTYPAFAVAWNMGNEGFMSGISFINELKLRAGWGIAASQGINPYSTLGGLGTSAYNFGQGTAGQQGGYVISSLPNESLKWQSTSQFNFGLDFAVLKNRISGSLEVYSQNTKDILLPVSLPPSNGGGTVFLNLGETKAHGLELTLNTVNIKSSSGFTWLTDFNYFFNREEIVELTRPDQKQDIGNGWFVGHPISVIYDYKKLGIWQTGERGLTTQVQPVQRPGDIKLQDVNGDNRITPDGDRMIIGNFQPKFEAGMNNRFVFKRFDFSFSVFARIGMKVVVPYLAAESAGSFFAGYNWLLTSRNNQLKVDYWTPSNPTNKFPQPDANTTPEFTSTLSYVDGSFVKCRSINLGYDLPSNFLGKAGINSLRVYVSAVNPFVIWAPFVDEGYGPDPEGNGYGGAVQAQGTPNAGAIGRQITVNANTPATRQWLFGVNLNF